MSQIATTSGVAVATTTSPTPKDINKYYDMMIYLNRKLGEASFELKVDRKGYKKKPSARLPYFKNVVPQSTTSGVGKITKTFRAAGTDVGELTTTELNKFNSSFRDGVKVVSKGKTKREKKPKDPCKAGSLSFNTPILIDDRLRKFIIENIVNVQAPSGYNQMNNDLKISLAAYLNEGFATRLLLNRLFTIYRYWTNSALLATANTGKKPTDPGFAFNRFGSPAPLKTLFDVYIQTLNKQQATDKRKRPLFYAVVTSTEVSAADAKGNRYRLPSGETAIKKVGGQDVEISAGSTPAMKGFKPDNYLMTDVTKIISAAEVKGTSLKSSKEANKAYDSSIREQCMTLMSQGVTGSAMKAQLNYQAAGQAAANSVSDPTDKANIIRRGQLDEINKFVDQYKEHVKANAQVKAPSK